MRRNWFICCLVIGNIMLMRPVSTHGKVLTDLTENAVIECREDTDWNDVAIVTKDSSHFLFSDSSFTGDVVAQLDTGTGARIVMEKDNWYFVQSGVYRGFLKKSADIVTGDRARMYAEEHVDKQAVVNKDTVYIHEYTKEGHTGAYVVGICGRNDELVIGGRLDDGYLIEVNGVKGVVSDTDVEASTVLETAREPEMYVVTNETDDSLGTYADNAEYDVAQALVSKPDEEELNEDYGDAFLTIVNYAKLFIGRPYVWGGEDLMEGVDCSGFIMKVYEHYGIRLPHSSFRMRSCGECVTEGYFDEQKTRPGDIICYDGHVALYIGDGKIIHAANRRDGIKISDADYRDDIICVRRIMVGHGVWGEVTDEEFRALCRIVEAEAGVCSLQEKIYVADVVLNRVRSEKFTQSTIIGVITAPGQFQPVTNGSWQSSVPSTESIYAVRYALNHYDSSMGALYFMNPSLSDPDNVSWFESSLHYLFHTEKTYFFR